MDNKKLLLLTTILTISGGNISFAENKIADQIAKQPSAAIASDSENAAFE